MVSNDKPRRRPVTLTKKHIQEQAGADLLQICQTMAADGSLTDEEINGLADWLSGTASSDIPGILFLRGLVNRILEDQEITDAERKDLFAGIERVLPADVRETVRIARRRVETVETERNRPIEYFDFMVAGAKRREYSEMIEGVVDEGDEIFFEREPDNPADENAVCVHAGRNYKIGYVPRADARTMAKLLDGGSRYQAHVKKILGYDKPIPVVMAQFFSSAATREGLHDKTDAVKGSKGCGCSSFGIVVTVIILILLLVLLL